MEAEDRSVFEIPYVNPDKTISYGKSEDQVIDFYNSSKAIDSIIILIHGGYWRPEYDRKHLAPFAKALALEGWPIALIEYRRIIGNPDAAMNDVNQAIEEVAKQYSKYVLIGHSAGGHLALLAAQKTKATGVIALAPLTDLLSAEELDLDDGAVSDFLGAPASIRSDLDPMLQPALQTPTVLIHGELDLRVPFEFATRFTKSKEADNLLFIPLEGIGHFELIDPRQEIFKSICQQVSRIIA